jgi:hypothetical protein
VTQWTEGSWEMVNGDYAPVLPPNDIEYVWYCVDSKWNRPQPLPAHMLRLMILQTYYYKKARAEKEDAGFTGQIEPPRWWWAQLTGPTSLPEEHPRCQR